MGVTLAILITTVAIWMVASGSNSNDARLATIWAFAHLVLCAVLSVATALLHPFLVPAVLVPHRSLFDTPMPTGLMVLSFALDKVIYYGPVVLVTVVMFLLTKGPSRGPRRPQSSTKDWRGGLV